MYGWTYYSLIPDLMNLYKDVIVGSAPHVEGRNKYGDIVDMLSSGVDKTGKQIDIDDFVVIDDDPVQGLEGFGEQFFKTTKRLGLTMSIAKSIVSYFNSYKFV
jgi:hypothetical protein